MNAVHESTDRADTARKTRRRGGVRHCLVSGARRDKADLIRFVLGPDGVLTPDPAERLPGRGLWVSADRDILRTALAKRLFAKAARAPVTVPGDLIERLEELLARRCRERIAMARRAGGAVSGYEKALAWAKKGKAGLVVVADDAGACVRTTDFGARGRTTGLGEAVRGPLSGAALGGVFGRDRAVYVAVARGPLADGLRADLARLACVRGTVSGAPDKEAGTTTGPRNEQIETHG